MASLRQKGMSVDLRLSQKLNSRKYFQESKVTALPKLDLACIQCHTDNDDTDSESDADEEESTPGDYSQPSQNAISADPWDIDINLDSELLLATTTQDHTDLDPTGSDGAIVEEGESTLIKDAGEWPSIEFS